MLRSIFILGALLSFPACAKPMADPGDGGLQLAALQSQSRGQNILCQTKSRGCKRQSP